MAIQIIFTGTTPNDGTGDNLKVGAGKINDNFGSIISGSSDINSIQFTLTGSGVHSEGKVEWDSVNKTMKMYTDEPDVALQMGQELWMRIYNNTTSSIANSKVCTVIGVDADGVPMVDLAIASEELSALNVVGISTHDIPAGTFGWVTTRGFVSDADTYHLTDGALVYLSAVDRGELVDVRPPSPAWEVKMGGNTKKSSSSGSLDGKIYVEPLVLNNLHGLTKFFNGSILEEATVVVTSDNTDVTLTLDNAVNPGENLSLIFDEEFHVMTAPKSITLISGSIDSEPVSNYVYIPSSSKELTVNSTGFPIAEQFIPVATLMVQTPTSVSGSGVYKLHSWIDSLSNEYGVGHLTQINSFIRQSWTIYKSGNDLTPTPTENIDDTRIDLQYTNGVVSQLHFHLVPGYDTSTGSPIFVINDFTTPFKLINGLQSADLQNDSTGASLADGYYNVVLWGTDSENFNDCKLFLNLPSKSYTKIADAINDADSTADYSIPRDFSGVGYLMTKLVLKNTAGNIRIATGGITSLLGLVPSTGAGGGVTSIIETGVAANAVIITAKVSEVGGITKGQVVYLNGSQGGTPLVTLADNTDFTKADLIGIATETKTNNSTILVTTNGLLDDFDTSAFSDGDIVYLGTAGAMTNIHPSGINAVQRLGTITYPHSSQGSMIVDITPLTLIGDNNGILRQQIVNINAGTGASTAYTLVNDLGQRASISMVGSNFTAVPGIASSLDIYNEGYNKTFNVVDGNFGFEWWTDTTDSHNLSSTSKMSLSASGSLWVQQSVSASAFILPTNVPTSISGSGTEGEIRTDTEYIYVCTSTNTWKRSPLTSW
jgi:hypothetical protein